MLTVLLLILGITALIYVCTPWGRTRLSKRFYRLGNDNNAIIFPLWVIVLISALFSLDTMIKGSKSDHTQPSMTVSALNTTKDRMPVGLDLEWQHSWNEHLCSMEVADMEPLRNSVLKKTDEQLIAECTVLKNRAVIKQTEKLKEMGHDWVVSVLMFFLYWRTSTLVVIALLCTAYVLRDELVRCWEAAEDRMRVRTGKGENLPDIQTSATPSGGSVVNPQAQPASRSIFNGRSALARITEYVSLAFIFELLEEIYKQWRRAKRGEV